MTVDRMLGGGATEYGEEELELLQITSNRNRNNNHSFAFVHKKQMERGRNNHTRQDAVRRRTNKYMPAVQRNTNLQKDVEVGHQYRCG